MDLKKLIKKDKRTQFRSNKLGGHVESRKKRETEVSLYITTPTALCELRCLEDSLGT